MPNRQWGNRVGNPPNAATSFNSSWATSSNTVRRGSSPNPRADSRMESWITLSGSLPAVDLLEAMAETQTDKPNFRFSILDSRLSDSFNGNVAGRMLRRLAHVTESAIENRESVFLSAFA